jgi:ferredoxin
MAHATVRSNYQRLVDRLNRFPQGAPPSDLLFKILSLLFSEREADLVSRLPIKPFSSRRAARLWGLTLADAQKHLDDLASRGLLLDSEADGVITYTLPPPMAGFFEFSMMRIREDIDQKLLSELFYQYLNQEDEFIRALFAGGETQLGRVFVNEGALEEKSDLHILDYERASEVIKTATHLAVSMCYCRHKMGHLNRACDAPMDICMTFNSVADSLSKKGIARRIDVGECLELLDRARGANLVQFGENVREEVSFICNCCGCCCEALLGYKRFGAEYPIRTNFLPKIDDSLCNGCGRCVDVCPVEAAALVSDSDAVERGKRRARIDETICLGCGVCVRNCSRGAIRLEQHPSRLLTPINTVHRTVIMAIERGKLQHLLFDNRVRGSHRAMAALLGVILRLPPLKQALASRQMKSRYLEYLITRFRG